MATSSMPGWGKQRQLWPRQLLECDTIDNVGDVGRWTSLHVGQGASEIARIAYYDAATGKLKFAAAVNGDGNCGPGLMGLRFWRCSEIDDVGVSSDNMGVSLVVDSKGRTRIAYHDTNDPAPPLATGKSLKLAQSGRLLGGNCGPGVGVFRTWTCETLDSGLRFNLVPTPSLRYNDVGSYVDIALSSADLATVAYYDASYKDLLVIQERVQMYLPVQFNEWSSP